MLGNIVEVGDESNVWQVVDDVQVSFLIKYRGDRQM